MGWCTLTFIDASSRSNRVFVTVLLLWVLEPMYKIFGPRAEERTYVSYIFHLFDWKEREKKT